MSRSTLLFGCPIIIASLSSNQIARLSTCREVSSIYYCGGTIELEPSMTTALNTIEYDTATTKYPYTGAGVKIGIIEREYVEPNLFPNVNITLAGTPPTNPTAINVEHANKVCSVITSVAPEAEYYSTRVNYSSDVKEVVSSVDDCFDYLSNEIEVDIINMSMGANYSNTVGNSRDVCADIADYYVSYYGVVLVVASGNVQYNDTDHDLRGVTMSYNAIVVGSINDQDTPNLDDDVWSDFSRYNSSSNAPSKPDIVAPGENIWFSMYDENSSGTSYSAPLVTGGIALAMQANPDLKGNVSAAKALLSACVSTSSPHRYVVSDPEFKKMGAGLLDINEMIHACDHIVGGSVTPAQSSYLNMYNCPKANMKVRLALSYLLSSESCSDTPEYADLNIVVYDPTYSIITSATTNHGNIEIVEFDALTAGNYYVYVYASNIAQDIPFSIAYQFVCMNHGLLYYQFENSVQHMGQCSNCAYVELGEHNYVGSTLVGWRCTICNHETNAIVSPLTVEPDNLDK